jgi:hypothetical protein
VGNQDQQRKSQFKPMVGMPGNRNARRAEPDAPGHDATPPLAGGKGGQFRRMPFRRNPQNEGAAAEHDEASGEWDDRFAARHVPERVSDTPPRSRTRRDDDDASAGRSWPRGDRSYADDFGAPRQDDAYDRSSARDGRRANDDDYADPPPRSRRAARDAAWAARERAVRDGDDAAWDDAEYSVSASQRDPWRRDWVQWTSTDLPVEDIMTYGAADFRRSRAAWGGEPDPYTMASVALVVDLPVPNAAKAKANAKPKAAIKQFINWANHRFAASERPTKRAMRVLLASTILGIVLLTGLGAALTAYSDYTTIKGLATDALNSLGHLGDDLGLGKNTTPMTDAQRSAAAAQDVTRAANDMQELHDRLAHPDLILGLAGRVSKVQTLLQSGLALSSVGIDATSMLLTLVPTLVSLSKVISSSPIATSTTPQAQSGGLTASDPPAIVQAIQSISPTLTHMIGVLETTPPSTLVAALNSKQQGEILPFLQALPGLPNALVTFEKFLSLPSIDKLLGIDTGISNYNGPVGYLIMTLDNSEIRPVGGFQGQFAVVGVDHGKIGHITLQDVYNYLEPVTYSNEQGQGYAVYDNYQLNPMESWFPAEDAKGNGLGWVMRNSGLSPDFPQSARYALWYLHNENLCIATDSSQQSTGVCAPCALDNAVGQQPGFYCYGGGDRIPNVASNGSVTGFGNQIPMAGVIMIQSTIIQQLLEITGPVYIGCPYDQSVDAAHLKYYIHYYQETYAGRQKGMGKCSTQASDTTKRFTGLLTQALQEKIKDMPKDKLLQFLGVVLQDLGTKNIQMFFTDPTAQGGDNGQDAFASGYNPKSLYPELPDAENFLRTFHDSSELYQGATDDALSLNRADVAGWKLEPFVKVNVTDQIAIDKYGNATHQLATKYTITIPPIVVTPTKGESIPSVADVQNAVYDVVYDANNGMNYVEYWRVYTNPNAQFLQGNYANIASAGTYGEDVPNRSYAGGNYEYSWSYVSSANNSYTVTWQPTGQAPPTLSWMVPHVVKSNGQYVLHLEPQSGVNTTMQITITLPNGATCQSWNGALTQTSIVTVNAKTGLCHG